MTCTDVKEGVIENPAFGNGDIIRFTVSFDDLLDTEGARGNSRRHCQRQVDAYVQAD